MGKKEIRNKFKNDVLARDNFKCKVCGGEDVNLDAHHIIDRHDMPNGGYVVQNGITLCDKPNGCHMKAEMYHKYTKIYIKKHCGKEYDGYSPEDLYKLINSSYELAYRKSENL